MQLRSSDLATQHSTPHAFRALISQKRKNNFCGNKQWKKRDSMQQNKSASVPNCEHKQSRLFTSGFLYLFLFRFLLPSLSLFVDCCCCCCCNHPPPAHVAWDDNESPTNAIAATTTAITFVIRLAKKQTGGKQTETIRNERTPTNKQTGVRI